jgi:hypothetical protein
MQMEEKSKDKLKLKMKVKGTPTTHVYVLYICNVWGELGIINFPTKMQQKMIYHSIKVHLAFHL